VNNSLSHGDSFDVVYTAYDGNTTVAVSRTVNIVDTVPPVITIIGDNPYTLERFDVYTDPGATTDLGSTLTTDLTNVNNILVHGSSFDVVYTAYDGNTTVQSTRTVNVVDTTPPVITILGDNPYIMQPLYYFPDLDPGVSVDIGTTLISTLNTVNNTQPGSYTVTYTASDGINPDVSKTRIVSVNDTFSPVITIAGDNPLTLERYSVYIDQGVTVDVGSILTSTISTVDNTAVGSYTVTYTATDNINPDTVVSRIVNVIDTSAPIVTLNGANPLTIERFATFSDVDPGVSIDANGTLVSVDISQFDNTLQGSYTVTYNVVDDQNNANVITRNVIVEDTIPPVVTLNNESTSYTLQRYGDWSAMDPGVTVDRGSYVDSVTVDNTSTGLKIVTYTVKDGTNTTQINRVITVVDTIAPVGSINNPSYQLERFGVFSDPGVTGLDAGTYLVGTDLSNVDATLPSGSTFDVVYDLGDGTNNTYIIRNVTVVDTTPPDIIVTGGDVTVERFSTYVDLGATVDVNSILLTTNFSNVDTSLSSGSTFDIVYNAVDASGNESSNIRTVTIQDTIAPVASLIGPSSISIEIYDVWEDIDPGINLDTGSYITSISGLNNTVVGTYLVTYNLSDGVNSNTITRAVTVVDTIPPVITLANGDEGTTNYTVERGTTYVDPGATADGGETITVDTSELNMAVSGTYTVTISATDAAGNIGTATRTVIVEDTIAPVITLANGDEGTTNYTVERGTTYVDPGATSDTGETVTVNTSQLNMAVSGTYTVTYSATDADDNIGTASRTVIVQDTIAPVITLANGDEGTTNYTVERGTTYVDPGATADTGETVTVDTSELNMDVSETYTVRYSATDVDGNIGTASRTVIVEDTTAPVITLNGADPFVLQIDTPYIELGATTTDNEVVTSNAVSNVNMNIPGEYTVTYSAIDAYDNESLVNRTVIVDPIERKLIRTDDIFPKDSYNYYGSSVAVSDDGKLAVVGASGVNGSMLLSPPYYTQQHGLVFIYERDIPSNTWNEVVCIFASDTPRVETYTTYIRFGATVAVSSDGSTVIAGNRPDYNRSVYRGVYIYERSSTGWISESSSGVPHVAKLTPPQDNESFASAIAISDDGSTIVVGSLLYPYGVVYVYEKPNGGWSSTSTPTATLTHSGTDLQRNSDQFGYSLAIDGSGRAIVVGGNALSDQTVNNNIGFAYVYEKPGGGWSDMTETYKLEPDPALTRYDKYGFSVAISDSMVLVGAPGESNSKGAVYLYTRSAPWSEPGTFQSYRYGNGPNMYGDRFRLTASTRTDGAQFGTSVSLSNDGSTAIVGTGTSNGAYIYKFNLEALPPYLSGDVSETFIRTPSDLTSSDSVGSFVSLSGDGKIAFVNSPNDDHSDKIDNGSVYILNYI
jgi:hypothetical protein